ncbi:MAG TPA: bifunctional homocysteine S-methyltransferase/methylenetetrahydrofolate reductase, partial [Chthoniobacteraceae bacterium]
MDFLDELHSGLLCGDGAMGTEIMARGALIDGCFEELVCSEPNLIAEIHTDYLKAGARVIETNSFGANAVRLGRFGFEGRVREINATAARLAKSAAKLGASDKNIYVAGSVGSVGLSLDVVREQGIGRRAVYQEQISALLDGGVDLIQLETFLSLEEILLALKVAKSISSVPVVCSMVSSEEGRLSTGESIVEAFRRLTAAGADVVGLNCLTGPHAMLRVLEKIPLEFTLSTFPNAGHPLYREGRYLYGLSPDYFATAGREFAAQGARLIGGCCGIGPEHIAALSKALEGQRPASSKHVVSVTESPAPTAAATSEETSILDLVATGKKVIVTELDPPKTLDLEKFFAGAQALTAAGSDAITLADNSLAILRVANVSIGALLKERFNIMPLLHISCRDRNLLGLQSELMGIAALGIRHVLPLTGDPAKVGDHPGASSVYDVNSIELMRIISRLNEGYNHAGKSIKVQTNFVQGCTFNPNARNLDAQVARLERKIAAGA